MINTVEMTALIPGYWSLNINFVLYAQFLNPFLYYHYIIINVLSLYYNDNSHHVNDVHEQHTLLKVL